MFEDFAGKNHVKSWEESKKDKSVKFVHFKVWNNKTIIGYGASGQANTIMSIFDINKDDLLYIVDDSPLKHGLFTPRNHIQIKSRYNIINDKPSYIYVLAYTFFDEIKNKNDNIESTWIKPILKC